MNKYLNEQAVLDRLLREYTEHGKLLVAYDFDDTVCTYTPGNPEPTLERKANEEICQLLRDLRPYATFTVWTCRADGYEYAGEADQLTLAKQWLDNHNVPYDYVNDDGDVKYGGRKIYANVFLDDRAGLATIYNVLKQFLERVQQMDIFNPYRARRVIVESIQEYFGEKHKAVIGMSGGVDSTVVAALCVEALGAERVFGVCIPNGFQADLPDAMNICEKLGIAYRIVDIEDQVNTLLADSLGLTYAHAADVLRNNVPALVRRNVLTTIAMAEDGRVMNTTNQTEEFLGYITKDDNTAGNFAPLLNYVKTEVIAIGRTYINIPVEYIEKPASDGMCGQTDEQRFGFSYQVVDDFIRRPITVMLGTGFVYNPAHLDKIHAMHKASEFKRTPIKRAPYTT